MRSSYDYWSLVVSNSLPERPGGHTEGMAVFLTQDSHTAVGEVMAVIRYSIAIVLAVVNFAIAAAFLVQKCRRSNVHLSPAGVLVLNLLFADAIVGVVIFRLSTHRVVPPEWCMVTLGIGYMSTIGSHVAVLNVVLDRFIAVAYTLQYREFMTLTRSVVMVCCGWSLPIAGLIGAIAVNDWNAEPVARCSEIPIFRTFLEYIAVPSQVIPNLCAVVLQFRLYICLRRHDAKMAESNHPGRSSSHKAGRLLFRYTTPTYIAMLSYDVVLIIVGLWINQVVKSIHDVLLLFVEISYLMNPLVYAYATANIRIPVSDLCSDFTRWLFGKKSLDSSAASLRLTPQISVVTTTI